MTLREKIEVMQAFERGEEIEVSYVKQDKWTDIANPDWSWVAYNYRIKPKPKQVVVIEKWLCSFEVGRGYQVLEKAKCFFDDLPLRNKVKLLYTYEVEL